MNCFYYLKNKWLNGFNSLAKPDVKCNGWSTILNTKHPSGASERGA